MATELRSDPELTELLERARTRAAEDGEVLTGPTPVGPSLSSEAGQIVASWLDDGGYDRAVADITAEDPDLRSE